MKNKLIQNAEAIEFIGVRDEEDLVVIAVNEIDVVNLIEEFMENLELKIFPEGFKREEMILIESACDLLGVKPHQEKIAVIIDHYFEDMEDSLTLDFNVFYSFRTLVTFGLINEHMDDINSLYTNPFSDDYETIIGYLEDVGYLECGGQYEIIDFMKHIYNEENIKFRDFYEEEGTGIIELEVSESFYNKYIN